MIGRQPSPRVVCCARCGAPNVIKDWHVVTDEFSVKCRSCDRRAIYRAKDLKPLEGAGAAEPPPAPRRGPVNFGVKRSA
ncbi:MAG: hypothetical protein JSR72_05810 [Proteobacteria bacterium]|nr:hypothetical protein [Pseudomonadota bacterium]